MKKLIILLSLKDRHKETKVWFENNYHSAFNYIIADGSLEEENNYIFSKINKSNLLYLRFKKDLSYKDYYKKVYKASLLIKTPFVMQVDNDDILNFTSINECLDTMDQNNTFSIISGHISGFNVKKNKNYLSDFKENNCSHIQDNNKLNQIINYLKNYRIIWYSIYRTAVFQKAWEDCFLFSCKHVLNTEILHGLSSLANGYFTFKNNTTYIRNTSQTDSIFRNTPIEEIQKSKDEIKEILLFISKKYDLDKNKILEAYQKANKIYKNRNMLIRMMLFIIRKKSLSHNRLISIINKINFLN